MTQLKPREQIVLDMLTNAAERGDECPTNSLLTVALGAGSISLPPTIIRKLEAKRLIVVERGARCRRVTILATGKQTAEIKGATHWRNRGEGHEMNQRDSLAQLVADGLTIEQAGRKLHLGSGNIYRLWGQIRDGLGWQAV